MRPPIFFLLSLLLFFCNNHALQIDNELVGEPIVDCQASMVSLTFTTRKPFNGRVYVKGMEDDDRCSRNFQSSDEQTKFSMQIQNGACNMQQAKLSNISDNEGAVFSMTVVVSFHGTFVTKVDRAFRCMCFFRNIQRLTNFLDMSMIGTTELLDTTKMPTCTYTIRSGGVEGPEVRYSKLGDKIYHCWHCDDDAQGILIHSCMVNDGRGNNFALMDINGCAVDPLVFPDPKYEPSLNQACVETHGFKFSDTSALDFMCVLELCKKAQGECVNLTPPNCNFAAQKPPTKRSAANLQQTGEDELELRSNLMVLETLGNDLEDSKIPSEFLQNLNQLYFRNKSHGYIGGATAAKHWACISKQTFGITLVAFCLIWALILQLTYIFGMNFWHFFGNLFCQKF